MPVLPLVASTSGHAGPQCAAFLGVPDHGGADAALHRVGRVAALDLGENRRRAARIQPVDAHQRRAADGLGVVVIDGHAAPQGFRCIARIFLLSTGEMPEQFCYERLPVGYKGCDSTSGIYAAGVTERGWGRPMKKPCTKSMPMLLHGVERAADPRPARRRCENSGCATVRSSPRPWPDSPCPPQGCR